MKDFLSILFLLIIIAYIWWEEIEDLFLYLFVPEKINVQGIIVDVYEKNIFMSTFTENIVLPIHSLEAEVFYQTFYYVKVLNLNNEYKEIEISFDVFNKMKNLKNDLDLNVSLSCKKFAWDDEIFLYAID